MVRMPRMRWKINTKAEGDSMKITLDQSAFLYLVDQHGRLGQLTREGWTALFDWYERVNPYIEADVIAMCCDWAYYADGNELHKEHDITVEELQDRTTVIVLPNGGVLVNNY